MCRILKTDDGKFFEDIFSRFLNYYISPMNGLKVFQENKVLAIQSGISFYFHSIYWNNSCLSSRMCNDFYKNLYFIFTLQLIYIILLQFDKIFILFYLLGIYLTFIHLSPLNWIAFIEIICRKQTLFMVSADITIVCLFVIESWLNVLLMFYLICTLEDKIARFVIK